MFSLKNHSISEKEEHLLNYIAGRNTELLDLNSQHFQVERPLFYSVYWKAETAGKWMSTKKKPQPKPKLKFNSVVLVITEFPHWLERDHRRFMVTVHVGNSLNGFSISIWIFVICTVSCITFKSMKLILSYSHVTKFNYVLLLPHFLYLHQKELSNIDQLDSICR